ncbi:MAG TPA: hypothetical protein VFK05_19165 [Polyangiaceae bacterium]|nr:hypothetical protein [Polyangiaceae bacterium]
MSAWFVAALRAGTSPGNVGTFDLQLRSLLEVAVSRGARRLSARANAARYHVHRCPPSLTGVRYSVANLAGFLRESRGLKLLAPAETGVARHARAAVEVRE